MKWLERLTCGADSCRIKLKFGQPVTGKPYLSIQQYKWVPILNEERIRQGKEKDGNHFSYAMPLDTVDCKALLPKQPLDYRKAIPL